MTALPLARRGLLALPACAALPRFAIAQGDTRPAITIAVQKIANTNTLEIAREASNAGTRHYGLYGEPLIGTDWTGDLSLQPGLAESWRIIDDRIAEITLRRGVRFHNGELLTADDVAFSLGAERLFGIGEPPAGNARAADPRSVPAEVRASARATFPGLEPVEVLDAQRLRIRVAAPDPVLALRLSHRAGVITSRHAFREAESWLAYARRPIGTGPYRVAGFRPDSMLELEAFDDYWGGRPPLRRIRFVEVPEPAARLAGLFSGEFDFACDVNPDQIAEVERDPRLEIAGGRIQNHRLLMLDKHAPALRDPRVRQAMALAVDRQAIIDALWAGRTAIAPGLQFESFGSIFIAEHRTPGFDREAARRLLREAGYAGEPIPYRISNNYYTAQIATAQILTEMWRAVGLNVQMLMVESNAQMRLQPRAVNDLSNTAFFPDPVSSLPLAFAPDGSQPREGYWRNEEAFAQLAVLQSAAGPAARRAAFARLLHILEWQDPAYILLHQTANFIGKKRAYRWRPSQSFVMDFRAANWGDRT